MIRTPTGVACIPAISLFSSSLVERPDLLVQVAIHYSLRCIVLFLASVIAGIQPGPIFLAVFSQWDQIFKDPMTTAAVESFQADHQRHTELVHEQFR